MVIIFYDFEVFKHDWLAVFADVAKKEEKVIINDPDELKKLYESNSGNIWVGYNNKHYDQYIMKGILLGMNPKEISDYILEHGEGWSFSRAFNQVSMINYDVMPNPPVGLKTLEGFMGSDIRETDVPFDIDRKLTRKEIEQTVHYCKHDVQETINVFLQKIDDFNAMHSIVKAFDFPLSSLAESEARITAKVLGCEKRKHDDEFDYFFMPCIELKEYKYVQEWFEEKRKEAKELNLGMASDERKKEWYRKQSFKTEVAGIPHTFGFGGLHGADDKPVHFDEKDGAGYHVDVNNYYPSFLIAWDMVTRSATNHDYFNIYMIRKQLKEKQLNATTKEAAMAWKKNQLPYKKMLNALSGAMKDKTNPAYDPRNNNIMCINGQLMLLDLIEHLEVISGFKLVQSNTDGLIIWLPDTDEAFDMLDDICSEWEDRCSTKMCRIELALDNILEIYQKDVNNYLWIDIDGSVESIGAYVKKLSPIDNDLPILNKALVEYMTKKTPVEKTINECDDLMMFQKIVKLSKNYGWVEHEHCNFPTWRCSPGNYNDEWYEYPETMKYTYKSYRVFASKSMKDGRLLKCGGKRGKPEKFANTPDHCFIDNGEVKGVKVPDNLDKGWYIDFAKKRLKDFGIKAV